MTAGDMLDFYIDGRWVSPAAGARRHDVINPARAAAVATIALGTAADVDAAVAAARRAFGTYSQSPVAARVALIKRIIAVYETRRDALATAVTTEMGAPIWLAKGAHAPTGLAHFRKALALLQSYEFEYMLEGTRILREPVGVCAMITPWNWPINQIACKVAPALAAGCTMVLKPSEHAPLSARLIAEILDEAGVPAGVFNLVNGDGAGVGDALAAHGDVDMVSFTGSTRGGVSVARSAAATVKRVSQELGGKSANILLDDVDLQASVTAGVGLMLRNSGQSCNAPSRMLVPRRMHDAAVAIAVAAAAATPILAAEDATVGGIGPVASQVQFDRVRALIRQGIDEGAVLAGGGLEEPAGLAPGYYVRPTVFGHVDNAMAIAREEIFGPVLSIIAYDDEAHAISIANDTVYGLAGYVQSRSVERARDVARQLRAGGINLNHTAPDIGAPFGGYKQSGNGREWGLFGLEEFLEVKAVVGWG